MRKHHDLGHQSRRVARGATMDDAVVHRNSQQTSRERKHHNRKRTQTSAEQHRGRYIPPPWHAPACIGPTLPRRTQHNAPKIRICSNPGHWKSNPKLDGTTCPTGCSELAMDEFDEIITNNPPTDQPITERRRPTKTKARRHATNFDSDDSDTIVTQTNTNASGATQTPPALIARLASQAACIF